MKCDYCGSQSPFFFYAGVDEDENEYEEWLCPVCHSRIIVYLKKKRFEEG